VLLAGIFSALSLVYGGKGWEWRITFLTFAASAPFQQYNTYLEGTYRAASEFRSLAWQQLVRVPIAFLLLLLPWRLGYDGFCAQNFLQAASSAVLCHWFRPVRAGPGLRKDGLRLLLSTGWRLYLTSYLLQVSQSLPRLALATLGGALLLAPNAAKEEQALLLLGLFTPVSWVVSAMNGVAGSVSSYLYPTLTYRYAKDNLPVGRVALRSAVKVTLGLVPCAAAGMAVMPLLLRLLRPEYLRSLWAVEVAMLSGLLDCLTVAGVAFAATKAWRPYYVFVACALAARAAGAYVGYHSLDDRLLGVALGMLAASAGMGLATWRTVRRAGLPAAPRSEVMEPC
jgi:O-antigen/teichoic acid export membrane protein